MSMSHICPMLCLDFSRGCLDCLVWTIIRNTVSERTDQAQQYTSKCWFTWDEVSSGVFSYVTSCAKINLNLNVHSWWIHYFLSFGQDAIRYVCCQLFASQYVFCFVHACSKIVLCFGGSRGTTLLANICKLVKKSAVCVVQYFISVSFMQIQPLELLDMYV